MSAVVSVLYDTIRALVREIERTPRDRWRRSMFQAVACADRNVNAVACVPAWDDAAGIAEMMKKTGARVFVPSPPGSFPKSAEQDAF